MEPNRTRAPLRLNRGITLAASALLLGLAACDDNGDPIGPNGNDNGHEEAARVEIQTRGVESAVIGVWRDGEGWTDDEGNPIDELEAPVEVEGEGLTPLRAGGPQASLTVTFFGRDGEPVEMETLERDDETRERVCSGFSARFLPTDADDALALAWPNMRHPDSEAGPFQFSRRHTGELVGIFHCDHIHLYPEREGELDIEFHLWHVDHSDDRTDPITVRVHPPEQPPQVRIETRGIEQATLGVWTLGEGWTDADGEAIDRIETPRDVEGEGLQPLEAFGGNASLSVRYFPYNGEEANIETLDRDDDTRERECSYIQGRYTVGDEETDAIAWPPMPHPDSDNGDAQFADWDGEIVGIFHCDHIHLYPMEAGEVDVSFTVYGGDQVLDVTDPITFPVNE